MRISLAAGETKTVTVAGGRFYYESGLGKITVRTIGNEAAEFYLKPGMGFQNKADQLNFYAVDIRNDELFDQDIDFIISYREVFDNRVTFGAGLDSAQVLGSVGIYNNQRLISEARKSFMWTIAVGAVASNYSFVAIRLPAGTGKKIAIQKITVVGASASTIILMRSTRMNVTQTTAGVSNLVLGAGGQPSKFIRLTPNVTSDARFDNWISTTAALSQINTIGVFEKPAGNQLVMKFDDPFILQETGTFESGLIVSAEAVNTGVRATFEYQEY